MCTREHIAALRAQSQGLAAAARIQPTTRLTPAEREQVDAYDRWLLAQSRTTLELAEQGEAASTADMRRAFNEHYMLVQMNMQRENQVFTSVANVLKSKHDTAKNSIGNVR